MCTGSENGAGFRQVTLLGLGVMGASLGLALKKLPSPPLVVGFSRSARTRAIAAELGVADHICEDPVAAARDADLVVGCLPIMALPQAFRDVIASMVNDAVLTDVGSTKQWLDTEIRAMLQSAPARCRYVGSHPMTGSEKSGPEAARSDLYRDAPVFLTPDPQDDPVLVDRLGRFWQAVGARVFRVSPAEHDRRAARTSHLPHLAAAALVAVAFRDLPSGMSPFIGPGFRDTTRVAGGSPDVWHDIVRTNSKALLNEMDAIQTVFDDLRQMIRDDDFAGVREFLDKSRDLREREVL